MENYNRQLRNSLDKFITNCLNQGFDLRESVINFSHILYKLEITEDPFENLYREYIISVMYIDAYKLNLYRVKQCIATEEETEFFGQLVDIEDIVDLLAEVSSNPEFLNKLIESCYQFRQLGSLGKMNLIKSLSESENISLLENFPIHEQDLETYDIEVNIEHIFKYIRGLRNYQIKEMGYEFLDVIVLNVVGFIQNLTNYDYNNAESLLLEIARKDYSASKYLNSHSNECDVFKEHIDLYEKCSKNDILSAFMEESSILKDALYHITCVYALKEYNNLSINIEEIDDCKDTEVMRKLIVK